MLAAARDKLLRDSEGKRPKGNATVVRYLAALSHPFTIAVKEWEWTDTNPVLKVKKPKEPRGRVRWLSDEERARLVNACLDSDSPDLYTAMVVAISTGGRLMEIMGLRWPQVDFNRRYLAMNGASNAEIAEFLGHKTLAMVKRYTHLSQAHTSGVVKSMNAKIFG